MNTAAKRIGAVTVGAALVIILIWYVALFSPESAKLRSAHAAHAATEAKIVTLDSQVSQLRALVKEIPADSQKLASLRTNVPDNPDLSDALGDLHQIADSTGIELTTVGPSPLATPGAGATTPAAAGTPSISLALSATGNYQETIAFLKALVAMPRTLVIDHLSLSSSQSSISISITARVFYANASSTNNGSPSSSS